MCRLVSSSARATSVAVMWAHALRAAAGGIFLLSTTANLCVVGPGCGPVKALPSDDRHAAKGTVPAAATASGRAASWPGTVIPHSAHQSEHRNLTSA